ncbi:hypothetical protein BZA70DRAFT_271857 [Myxozyma melibiosi]|uniref:D-xylose 1-dehydrogenase (NADP(+), D-xylono-1,5-lactone-forming) n=1 Tax=Myxozyma melibiosi TaxID=54550 RepID=A0ABR1FCS4_9ASCO
MSTESLPSLRWGIIGTGLIASWFVGDLQKNRPDRKADHIIAAVGASSLEKAKTFAEAKCPGKNPTTYGSYQEVYNDPNVDIIYIATPHAFHKESALAAMDAGKAVLCEKPMTINAKDAKDLAAKAKEKNVFLMEAVWTRFSPLVLKLEDLVHKEKAIGDVSRIFVDFGLDMNLGALPETSRLKNRDLGAGALLDIGIYTLTYGKILLDTGLGKNSKKPNVVSMQSLVGGIDYISTVILQYPETGAQAILTSSVYYKTAPEFLRIEGSLGTITVSGVATSSPKVIKITYKDAEKKDEVLEYPRDGFGFWYEADAVAVDIAAGKKEDDRMPLDETIYMLELMDSIRKTGGVVYPQDA